jgi:hypothetical protein
LRSAGDRLQHRRTQQTGNLQSLQRFHTVLLIPQIEL